MIFRGAGKGSCTTAAESSSSVLFHIMKRTMKTVEESTLHQNWCKNMEIFLTFADYRNLILSFWGKKKKKVNAIKHTQVIILMMKFHK